MKQLRHYIFFLGILALGALFLTLPETPNFFGIFKCKACASSDPYLPLMGAGYFAVLMAVSLLFPSFLSHHVSRGGLLWAVLLALTLTYLHLPHWCIACLIAHGCNILIWTILVVSPPADESNSANFRERLCLIFFAPVSLVALFSCLNLTFMAYGFKPNHPILAMGLQPGDQLPSTFLTETSDASHALGIVINFISPNCPFCQEQLPILDSVASQLAENSYRFINVSPALPAELVEQAPAAEWVEDKEGRLRELFKVAGYPTLFVVGADGIIAHVIAGVPEQLKAQLLTNLVRHQ